MEKYIKANEGFKVLDRLMARIQRNKYYATQKMLDTAWSEWINVKTYENEKEFSAVDLRREIIENIPAYQNYSEHNDLISFCVCSEFFENLEKSNGKEIADFNEVIVVVEKEWLFDLIKKTENLKRDSDVKKFLQEEYTSEDSNYWYSDAILNRKIVSITFN